MTSYKLTIQYVGTRYAGWQIQRNQRTVQGTLKEALGRLTGETVSVIGAGRTDSGVHALGQVAQIRLHKQMEARRLQRALNAILPPDIRIASARVVPSGFHAQKQAVRKRYVYRIFNGQVLPPFLCGLVCQVPVALDLEAMIQAAGLIVGRHDFRGFAAASSAVKDFRRTVAVSRLVRRGRHIRYTIEADGFLHHMVRNIVGTLLEIGRGKRSPSDMIRILESRDRKQAGPTAPPEGLYLVKVWYR
ncbi:MAG TPA: tRNA pseudouridine(38-40) synthase TruA [Acidobacteriota bacterium]|nr:tRNA pseudouridine(38-40) synthase TruA [Acidobacteriota bacterium]